MKNILSKTTKISDIETSKLILFVTYNVENTTPESIYPVFYGYVRWFDGIQILENKISSYKETECWEWITKELIKLNQ